MELRKHKAVKAYVQHGFIPVKDNDSQIIGNCPFCLRENKFYVNKESKEWDCKVCGKSGGFQQFLQDINIFCQENFNGKKSVDLSKSRGIKLKTLKKFGIGFNPITTRFTIPHYDYNKKALSDLRIYDGQKIISTYTCKPDIYNSCNLKKNKNKPVYICEGEWDFLSFYESLQNDKDIILVSVNGANSFNINYINLFSGRDVNILFDNDKAGIDGEVRIYNILNPVVKSLKFLHWKKSDEKSKDIRDLYKQENDNLLDYVNKNLHDTPQGKELDTEEKIEFADERISKDKVYKIFDRWLYLPDKSVIDVLIGTIIANRMQGDPVWLFLVAPPGLTKSELLQTTKNCPLIESVSKLTPKALVSGFTSGGYDPSLLPRLNNKTLVIKDFTAIFGMNPQARDEIFSTLRDAYDGNFVGVYGHGDRKYNSKFGILAGVTPVLENYMSGESAVGERFLRFNMFVPDSLKEQLKYMKKANSNIDKEDKMKSELVEVVTDCLNYGFPEKVSISDEMETRIFYMSILTATLRASVSRDRYSKEVLNKPFIEMGTRLSKQMTKLLIGISKFRGVANPGKIEFNRIKKIALDTVPLKTMGFITALLTIDKKEFTKKEMSESYGLSPSECGRLAENLILTGMMKKEILPQMKQHYFFSDYFNELIQESGVFDK